MTLFLSLLAKSLKNIDSKIGSLGISSKQLTNPNGIWSANERLSGLPGKGG